MWIKALTLVVFASVSLDVVSAQICPYGWYGYTTAANSKCYKFVISSKLTWQDARGYCQVHGGDLLKLESTREMNWIAGQLKSLTTRNHLRAPLWWTGLNNREFLTTWEWADGSATNNNYIHWKKGEPNNYHGIEGCAEVTSQNQFNDDICSNKRFFICNRARSKPLACDTDRGWQTINGKCYKLYSRPNSWPQAKRQCNHDSAALVTVDSQSVELAMHDFAAKAKKTLWIGLHSLKVGSQVSWVWTNGTQLSTGYWHGTPHINRNMQNTTCGYIANTLTATQDWNAGSCNTPRGYICQKPEGVCFPGWVGMGANCYQFDPQYRLSFGRATSFCASQGAELLRIDSNSDEMFVQSYVDEMKDSGSSSFWLGLSDDNHDGGPFKWRNHHTVGRYHNWATRTPTNQKGRQDCVYIQTNDPQGKWRTTTSCQAARSVVCRIPMNKSVKPIARTPPPHYGCPANWRLYQTTCYRIGDISTDQITARGRCKSQHGADLAVINSAGAQGFVNRMVRKGINYYIGLNDRAKNNVFVWNDNPAALTYTNWKRGEPNDFHGGENCAVLVNSQWNDVPCQQHAQYICSMSATNVINPSTQATTPAVDWTVKCGPGWQSNPTSSYCYLFSDQQLSWSDAMLQCRVGHGNLVSIVSTEEESYIAGILSTMTSIAVWTGANDRQREGGWRWTNGDPFAYLNWAPNQPGGNRGQGSDCVAMFTNTAQWDDVPCNSRNGYICKKLGNVPATTTPKTTAVSVPAGKKIGCRFGWRTWGGYCYAFIKRTTSWDKADSFCRSIGGNLASINSRNEQNFIQGVKPRAVGTYDAVWIGLNDKAIENRFQWSDGSPVTYSNWNTNEPNNWMNRNEDCVDLSLKTAKWNDEVCSTQKQGFLCKNAQSLVPKNQSPPPYIIGCSPGSYGFGSYCYKIVRGDSRSWTSASAKCKTYHGTLATVNDRYTQSIISSLLVHNAGNFWIGLTDTSKPGTYAWASGHALLYTSWGQNHTGNEQSTCVAMSARQPVGLWVNLPCTQRSNYICQLPRRGYTPPPTPGTPFPNVPCPQGWTQNYAYCIKFFSDTSIRKSWMDAASYCQGMGGDLASFHNKGNDTAALTLINGLKLGFALGVWIGLNDRATEGGHKWSDGTPVDYTHWNRGEPNNYKNAEDCVEIMPGGGWNDLNCYFQLPFLCAIPRGTTPITTIAPPVPVNSAQCGTSPDSTTSWFLYNNNCYLLSPNTGSNHSLSYYDAMTYCRGQKASLASIHSAQENGLLMSKIHTISQGAFWIGLNKLDNKDYKWTDGTPLGYVSWDKNQPNDYAGSERCAQLTKWTGFWNDDLCSRKMGFICKKPLHGVVHVVPPSPNTPGGCPNGFSRANGGRNKCFYLARGVNRNWTQAVSYCRSLGSKVDIASIEDAFESEFLITLATKNHASLWIGLNAHRGKNNFYWQDGSPLVFTNWDSNEPTSAQGRRYGKGTQNCVLARMYKGHEGRWADVPCSVNISFICQVKQDPIAPVHNPPATGSCRSGYMFYNGNCYKAKATLKSWPDAAADCKADGGNLASIANVYESAFIGTLTFTSSPFWLGLSDLKSPGLYYWNDGSRMVYASWAPREPSYGQKTGNGCVVSDNQGNWNDTYCNAKHYYICKITTTTIPPTLPAAAGNCPNAKWTANGDYCYLAVVNSGHSWPESNFICQQKGMQLASIHGKAEMDFVFNMVKQTKVTNQKFTPNIWLGLSKSAQGAFTWSDGTTSNYFMWAPSEPSALGTHGETQECVEFDRSLETWDATSCYSQRGFVCKAPKAFSTLPPSTVNVVIGPNGNVIQQPQQQTGGSSKSSGSSSNGATIAGAVLGSIFGVLILAFLALYLVRSGKLPKLPLSKPASTTENGATGFENTLYNKTHESNESES